MSGIESGFSFNGKHVSDFGLLYVEDSGGRVITHARRVNEYEIAGASGTIVFPGERYEPAELTGALFPLDDLADEAAAQALMRQVTAWLYGPQGRLIFDYEPDRFLLAQAAGESKWSRRDWMDGGLNIAFRVQPFAYALIAAEAAGTVTQAGATMALPLATGRPAPLEATITNAGASNLTGVTVSSGGKTWAFAGLSVPEDGALSISGEPPIGATLTVGSTKSNALTKATAFDMIELETGASVSVALSFEGGSGSADVTLRARGRWL